MAVENNPTLEKIRAYLTTIKGVPRKDRVVVADYPIHFEPAVGGNVDLSKGEMIIEGAKIFVAPADPIQPDDYGGKMNQFMKGLIPLEPTYERTWATVGYESTPIGMRDMRVGFMYFDENIGSFTRGETTFTSRNLSVQERFKPSMQVNNGSDGTLIQRIWVLPYPNIELARVMAEYVKGYHDCPWDQRTVANNSLLDRLREWISGDMRREMNQMNRLVPSALTNGRTLSTSPKDLGA